MYGVWVVDPKISGELESKSSLFCFFLLHLPTGQFFHETLLMTWLDVVALKNQTRHIVPRIRASITAQGASMEWSYVEAVMAENDDIPQETMTCSL